MLSGEWLPLHSILHALAPVIEATRVECDFERAWDKFSQPLHSLQVDGGNVDGGIPADRPECLTPIRTLRLEKVVCLPILDAAGEARTIEVADGRNEVLRNATY